MNGREDDKDPGTPPPPMVLNPPMPVLGVPALFVEANANGERKGGWDDNVALLDGGGEEMFAFQE